MIEIPSVSFLVAELIKDGRIRQLEKRLQSVERLRTRFASDPEAAAPDIRYFLEFLEAEYKQTIKEYKKMGLQPSKEETK